MKLLKCISRINISNTIFQTNPPFYAPLVELAPAPWADQDLLPQTAALMKKLRQVPVTVKKEILGYVLNRIQYALLRECFSLVRVSNDIIVMVISLWTS
jgi:L-gulonate 3-dehydrogenase